MRFRKVFGLMIFSSIFALFLNVNGLAQNVVISNKTNNNLYVYDYKYMNNPNGEKAVSLGQIPNKGTLTVDISKNWQNNGNRLYFSEKKLTGSIAKDSSAYPPNPLDTGYDGTINYSYIEYIYQTNTYTIDLSYINEFSFPVTITFGQPAASYTELQPNFEYGPTSMDTIKSNLTSNSTSLPWDNLVWNQNGVKRIVGPLSLWTQTSGGTGFESFVPATYTSFINQLPFNGEQLFKTITNMNGWNSMLSSADPGPEYTGYNKALQSSSTADSAGRYGFFTYPQQQNKVGAQFTYVPTGTSCTITVYPTFSTTSITASSADNSKNIEVKL